MDDEYAVFASFFEHLVHARGHLDLTSHGVFAVVQVPHVADDDGGARGEPLLFDQRGFAGGRAGLEREGEGGFLLREGGK